LSRMAGVIIRAANSFCLLISASTPTIHKILLYSDVRCP
jgi:hypothetical protein